MVISSEKRTLIIVYTGIAIIIHIIPPINPAVIAIKNISKGWVLNALEYIDGCKIKLSIDWTAPNNIKDFIVRGKNNSSISGWLIQTAHRTVVVNTNPINGPK